MFKGFRSIPLAEEAFLKFMMNEAPFLTNKPQAGIAVAGWQFKGSRAIGIRGVDLMTNDVLFYQAPVHSATENVAAFLAIASASKLLRKTRANHPIYTSSSVGACWYKKRRANPNHTKAVKFDAKLILHQMELWLQKEPELPQIYLWNTEKWGRIPSHYNKNILHEEF